MPELPEVEIVRIGLLKSIEGLKITAIKVLNKKLRYPIPKNIEEFFQGKTVKTICRRAKHGIIVTNADYHFHFHLGMTGTFKIIKEKDFTAEKHDHLIIHLNNKINLIYSDVRKFGYISLIKKPFDIVNYKKLGHEPSMLNLHMPIVTNIFCNRKKSIKSLLLDQSIIAGIGNIYANEILFDAKIHPESLSNKISKKNLQKIFVSTSKIIKKSIKQGGSSIKDYKNPEGNLGYFQNDFTVYGKEGFPCYKCKSLIKKIKQMGRASYFCPACQKIYK